MAHVVEKLRAQACGLERQIMRAEHLLFGVLAQAGRIRALFCDDGVAPPQCPLAHNVDETCPHDRNPIAHYRCRQLALKPRPLFVTKVTNRSIRASDVPMRVSSQAATIVTRINKARARKRYTRAVRETASVLK